MMSLGAVVQAGARKVYAVEASGMAKFAQQLVAASGICLPPPSGIKLCTCVLLQSCVLAHLPCLRGLTCQNCLSAQKHPAVCICNTLSDMKHMQAACINTPLHDHYI